ncbi:transmembrane protein 71 isoform X1 [Myotis myotis]|uniref:Transmembrane protein 71 n=1 Tax=Myotis myotis TaxID=51298 RepID=A0A7J7TKU5_MYOMY|nr:transmembrane protein 71 isoform X1 [Myotis myotis]XP_036193554.1 transmembrane protein 71 isoform X1 [Myotis myotis]KAF6300987.1 transmembrane protein 71 [Myotis myotis]
MYRTSRLMSTPVASQCSSGSERESAGELSPTCIFPSFACDFLAGDGSFDCCSLDPLTGSYLPCRRSPRLLTNGYYIWTEDSFLCDRDGNITLSPSQTSVMYRENSVRIFRKKKRVRSSFPSLLRLGASRSWLRGSIFADADSSLGEASWLEGAGSLDAQPCSDSGGDFDCALTDDWASERLEAESVAASSPGHLTPETPGGDSLRRALQPQGTAAEHLQRGILDHSKTSSLGEISFQTVLLAACLAMSACARWLLGGLVAGVFTCSLTITIAYVVKSLLLSLASYFNAGPCARRHPHTLLPLRPMKTRTSDFTSVSISTPWKWFAKI